MNSKFNLKNEISEKTGFGNLELERLVVGILDGGEFPLDDQIQDFASDWLDSVVDVTGEKDPAWGLISILMTVLYRNTYQSTFDIPVFEFCHGQDSEMAERYSAHFDVEHRQLFWRSKFDHAQSPFETGSDSALSVLILGKKLHTESLHIPSPICFVISQKGDGISARWVFQRKSGIAEFVEKVSGHLSSALTNLIADRKTPILNLGLFSDAELDIQHGFESGKIVHHEFARLNDWIDVVAAVDPNRAAIHFEEVSLSYAELRQQSLKIASGLLARGVKKGDRVAHIFEPCLEVVSAILASHRAGAVYVPIDPSFPVSRISDILGECQPKLIVYNRRGDALNQHGDVESCLLSQLNSSEIVDVDVVVEPEDVSHIFFTSGTTGRPKGVVATHANLFHYLDSAVTSYQFKSEDKFVAAARFTFSISLFELLVPLAAGGSVKILPRSTVLDMDRLSEEVARCTAFHFGPSLLKKLVSHIQSRGILDKFSGVKHASSGGDLVPPELLESMKSLFFNADIFVIYGCSEISCMGCTFKIPPGRALTKTPVGKPLQNTGIMLLDGHGNRVPLGIPGNVYFSGRGLVREYLDQPALTESKFRYFNGIRYYETGDLGRFDDDGNLELLGREDFQVKVRGIRIELLEIERWLKCHPAVVDCVVAARAISSDEKSLVAYLVARELVTSSNLIEHLAERLPDYMVPAIYVGLEKLPLNLNNKIDRSQLPAPNKGNMLLSTEFEKASGEIEQFLVESWQKIFGIDGIGIDDNFFELGGDSLRAVQVLYDVETKLGNRLGFSDFLEKPTIRELARRIDKGAGISVEILPEGVVLLRRGVIGRSPIFMLDGALNYRDLAAALDSGRDIYGVYLPEDMEVVRETKDGNALRFENIIDVYIKKITTVLPQGSYLICGHSFGGLVALEVARRLVSLGRGVPVLVMIDSWRPGFRYSMGFIEKTIEHIRLIKRDGVGYLAERMKKKACSYKGVLDQLTGRRQGGGGVGNKRTPQPRDIVREILVGSSYRPTVYEGSVLLVNAKDKADYQPASPYLGWEDVLVDMSLSAAPGDHYGMMKGENARVVAEIVGRYLLSKAVD